IDEIVEYARGRRIGQPAHQARPHRRADAGDLLEPLRSARRGLAQEPGDPGEPAAGPVHRLVVGRWQDLGQPDREVDRRLPADLRDAEPVEDPAERAPPRAGDRTLEVLGAPAGEPIEGLEVLDLQPVEVAARLDETALEQLLEDRPARALDVHSAPPGEVPE